MLERPDILSHQRCYRGRRLVVYTIEGGIMKSKFAVMAVLIASFALASAFVLGGCSSSGSGNQAEETYDTIYSEYNAKLSEQGSEMVSEFKEEAEGITDLTELATIETEKVTKLAETMNEGGTKMAELMYKNGDDYSVYEENYMKLYDVYSDQSMGVFKEYMNTYSDTIPGMTEDMKQQMLDQFEESLESLAPEAEK